MTEPHRRSAQAYGTRCRGITQFYLHTHAEFCDGLYQDARVGLGVLET